MYIPTKTELDKTNDILSNINKKLMTDFIQYLTAKNFFINPDKAQYSTRSYHSYEFVEFASNPAICNGDSRSKKWADLEDYALCSNWNNFISDQPCQFKRLFFLLLKKPSSYNIFTDTINFGCDINSNNSASTNCGIIKLRNLINEFIRITKLHARLGKGINRCLNSCYYRARLIITGGQNPIVTGPFLEGESQNCFHLYNTLWQSNHTFDDVCEQIGRRLNRTKELIGLYIKTLTQVKYDFPAFRTIPAVIIDNFAHAPLLETKLIDKPKNKVRPLQLATVETGVENSKTIEPKFELVAYENVEMLSSLEYKNKFVPEIEEDVWPNQVEDVLIYAIKWDYKHRLGLDLDALASVPQCLNSMIAHLNLNWGLLFKLLIIKGITDLSYHCLLPCIPSLNSYWKHKLKQKLMNSLVDNKVQNATQVSLTYDRMYFNTFLSTLVEYVLERKHVSWVENMKNSSLRGNQLTPREYIRLLSLLKTYFITFKRYCGEWSKKCPDVDWKYLCNRYNSDQSYPHLSEKRLKKCYKGLKRDYLTDYHEKNESEILDLLCQKCMPIFEDMIDEQHQEDDQPSHLQTILVQPLGNDLEKCDEAEVVVRHSNELVEKSLKTTNNPTKPENVQENDDDVVEIEQPSERVYITSNTLQNIKNEIKKALAQNALNEEQYPREVIHEEPKKVSQKRKFKSGKLACNAKKVKTKLKTIYLEDEQKEESAIGVPNPCVELKKSMIKVMKEKKDELVKGSEVKNGKKKLKGSINKKEKAKNDKIRNLRERLGKLRNALNKRKFKCMQLKNSLNLKNEKVRKQLLHQKNDWKKAKKDKVKKSHNLRRVKLGSESNKKNKGEQIGMEDKSCNEVVDEKLERKKKGLLEIEEIVKKYKSVLDNLYTDDRVVNKGHTDQADEIATNDVVECDNEQVKILPPHANRRKICIITIEDSD